MSITGTAITAESASSATCLIIMDTDCLNSTYPGTYNSGFSFCRNPSAPNSLFLPPYAPTAQAILPVGLQCNERTQCFVGKQYYCKCVADSFLDWSCSQDAFSDTLPATPSSSSPTFFQTLWKNNLYFGLFIAGAIVVGMGVLAMIWHCASGGKTFGPRGFQSYIKDRKFRREEAHRAKLLEQEGALDEEARAHANAVRREQELLVVEAERMAQRALETEQLNVAHEEEQDRLMQQRHDLMVQDMKRKDQLIHLLESTTDDYVKRQFEREMLLISQRSEQREEDLKSSGNYIKVLESTTVEDGRIVEDRKEIQRERYARTDREAQQLMGSVAPDMQHIQQQQQQKGNQVGGDSRYKRLPDPDML
ncbi:hypothetical protein BJ741DRAFT_640490 [Chytriomyces cf. hyalinus JEL632]|nr:hypothetical protein BJ741DRAFT_640490 [Chytriomyces cf. hyalinus JEL632]